MIEPTKLDGVLRVKPITYFEDFRGRYIESYNYDIYKSQGLKIEFVQDDFSRSHKGVLRGIHGDSDTWKLVSCIYGSFYLIVVNNDPKSSQYKQWISFTLSDRECHQILIPPKFGNGHLVISDEAIFHYKQSTYYDRGNQFTIKFDDPEYDFWWPNVNVITSERDKSALVT